MQGNKSDITELQCPVKMLMTALNLLNQPSEVIIDTKHALFRQGFCNTAGSTCISVTINGIFGIQTTCRSLWSKYSVMLYSKFPWLLCVGLMNYVSSHSSGSAARNQQKETKVMDLKTYFAVEFLKA